MLRRAGTSPLGLGGGRSPPGRAGVGAGSGGGSCPWSCTARAVLEPGAFGGGGSPQILPREEGRCHTQLREQDTVEAEGCVARPASVAGSSSTEGAQTTVKSSSLGERRPCQAKGGQGEKLLAMEARRYGWMLPQYSTYVVRSFFKSIITSCL